MRTQQLQVMVKNLRAEAGHALSTAQGVNQIDTLKYLLQRTQEELWTSFVWPDLVTRVDMPMVAGQYIYAFLPTMTYDMVRSTFSSDSGNSTWHEIGYGIGENCILPNGSNAHRADPVQAWDVSGPDSFRVYPTPDTNSTWIRFKGQQQLAPFIADSDLSTLDATCIQLFAAAEILARAKAEDAAAKLEKAQRHLTKLLANKISAKNKVSSLGGGSPGYWGRVNRNLIYGPGAG